MTDGPANRSGPIVIASANRWEFSQTFIRAHVERLPAQVRVLGAFAGGYGAARRLVSFRLEREINEVWRRLRGKSLTGLPNPVVRRFLRNLGARAVLAEFGPTAALLANDCKAARIPLIAHFHGYDAYSEPILATYVDSYRRLFASASAIVVVSTDMRRQLESLGAPAEKVFRNPCGADVDLFHGSRPALCGPHFLAVGRFVEKKAPHVTIQAFRYALDRCPDASLVMVGDGPLLPQAKAQVARLGLSAAVTFPGVLDHTGVATAMRSARAFVHHAVTSPTGDREGTPVSVLEAGASGLPVVSTVHGGIPDFVLHERTGYLVEEHDVEGMAEHMIALAENPELAASLGAAGSAHVRTHGTHETSIAALWRIIRGAIDGSLAGVEL